MAGPKARRRTGGPPVGLTREAILAAADTFDLADLSMPALAASLGVSHPALYHYFPTKAALVSALAEAALLKVRLPDIDGRDWRELIVEAATAMHDVWLANAPHPPASAASVGAAAVPITERILTALADAGCTEREAIRTTELIFALCLYSAMQNAFNNAHDLHTPGQMHAYLDANGTAADSPLRVMAEHYGTRSRDEIFHYDLDAILDRIGG
jgi:AcrR family transcriptional regulator